ncbi:transposase family protein [Streptomyces violascens]|uniref:transposase family protein n=1 Tax=Streptomyces violascens TaxID=67381 RepID=UPI00369339B0
MVPYRAMRDVPHEVVEHISWLMYARRRELNSRWRRLGCFRQDLLALAHLSKNETLAHIGAGFGVSTATADRYVNETVDVLAEHAPSLLDALQGHDPNEFFILDGTLIPTSRVNADEPCYSVTHRRQGMKVPSWPARTAPRSGSPGALPGRTHDLTSARAHGVIQTCLSRQILVLADRAYRSASATVRTTPYYGRDLPKKHAQFNRDHARLRAPGERAFARLKQWQIFHKARCSTTRVSRAVAAVHAIEIAWHSN